MRNLFWHFVKLKKPGLARKINEFNNNQYLSKDELNSLNWEKRKKIVEFAYYNVPYYKEKFDNAGFHPRDMKQPDDFLRVPLTTRDDIKSNLEEMVANSCNKEKLFLTGTGGTTGTPLMIYKQKNDKSIGSAIQARMLNWWGIHPYADFATAYRINTSNKDKIVNDSYCKRLMVSIKKHIKQAIQKRIQINPAFLSEAVMKNFIVKIKQVKPEYLVGYTGAINDIARFILSKKIKEHFTLKAVWTTSAPLAPSQRNAIEKAFGCPVYDQYGSIEVFWLAAECKKQNGLHVFYDSRHMEFLGADLNPTRPNESGRVVITNLDNYDFPLIRYVNGDLGSWKDKLCSCGISLPLINNIKGRSSDRIVLKDGSIISGEFLTTIFDDYAKEVSCFQVHQQSINIIEIKVEMSDISRFHVITKRVKENLRSITKDQIGISFVLVKEIKPENGKLRYIISDI